MKNLGKRFCGYADLKFVAVAACLIGQSPIGFCQQPVGVAPAASGYGNRPNTTQQANPAPIVQGNANPAGNPNLNPALNQRPAGAPKPGNALPGNAMPGRGSGTEVVTKDPYEDKPLTPQEQAYLDQILGYWEKSTADIERYSCKFTRWQYNSSDNFVAQLASQLGTDVRSVNTTAASGELKYLAPDKGMFRVEMLLKLTGQMGSNKQAEYKQIPDQHGEWWMCNGELVFEYDRTDKKCTKHIMPKEMQGTGILESPMPFMFGVKADKIKARYWVRALPPPIDQNTKMPRQDRYVIEAYPKFQSDAVNYDHVQIVLDKEMFLPVMMYKFNTEHVDEEGKVLNDNREVFQFDERVKNASALQKLSDGLFRKAFIPFDVPKDWKIDERDYNQAPAQDIRSANNPAAPPNNPAAPPNNPGVPQNNPQNLRQR